MAVPILALLVMVLSPHAAVADDTAAPQSYGPVDTRAAAAEKKRRADSCPVPKPGEDIVVCAPQYDYDPGAAGFDKESAEANYAAATMNRGAPRAPDVGPRSCTPGVDAGCVRIGRKPPHPLLIDLRAIPEAPPGSDAERIAKGERAE